MLKSSKIILVFNLNKIPQLHLFLVDIDIIIPRVLENLVFCELLNILTVIINLRLHRINLQQILLKALTELIQDLHLL